MKRVTNRHILEHLEKIDDRLAKVDNRFDQVDNRFDQVDSRFDQVESRLYKVEDQLQVVDNRLATVENRFDHTDSHVNTVDNHLNNLQQTMNDGFAEAKLERLAIEQRLSLRIDNLDEDIQQLGRTHNEDVSALTSVIMRNRRQLKKLART